MVLGNQLWVVLLEQGVGPADLQKSLPTSMLLWLCDQQIFIDILDPLKNRTFMGKFSPFPKTFNSSPWKIMLSNHISFPIYFSPYVSFSVWLIWNTSEIFIIWKYWFSLFFYSIKLRQLEVKRNTVNMTRVIHLFMHSQYFRYQIMFPFYLILFPLWPIGLGCLKVCALNAFFPDNDIIQIALGIIKCDTWQIAF